METELLNAVKYIKKFTCKEDLDNIIDSFIENGLIQVKEIEKMQLSKLPTKSTFLKYLHYLKVLTTAQKTLKKTTYSRIKRKIVVQWKHSCMTRV